MGLSDEQINHALEDCGYYATIERVYCSGIFSAIASDQYQNLSQEQKVRYDELLRRYPENKSPSPDEIRAFLEDAQLLTPEIETFIEDYAYYREHRVHRRPELLWEVERTGTLPD